MDVLLSALELLSVKEFRVWPIKYSNAVMPTQPMAELRSDNRRQWGPDRNHDDIDVMAGCRDTDSGGKEASCNK